MNDVNGQNTDLIELKTKFNRWLKFIQVNPKWNDLF